MAKSMWYRFSLCLSLLISQSFTGAFLSNLGRLVTLALFPCFPASFSRSLQKLRSISRQTCQDSRGSSWFSRVLSIRFSRVSCYGVCSSNPIVGNIPPHLFCWEDEIPQRNGSLSQSQWSNPSTWNALLGCLRKYQATNSFHFAAFSATHVTRTILVKGCWPRGHLDLGCSPIPSCFFLPFLHPHALVTSSLLVHQKRHSRHLFYFAQ